MIIPSRSQPSRRLTPGRQAPASFREPISARNRTDLGGGDGGAAGGRRERVRHPSDLAPERSTPDVNVPSQHQRTFRAAGGSLLSERWEKGTFTRRTSVDVGRTGLGRSACARLESSIQTSDLRAGDCATAGPTGGWAGVCGPPARTRGCRIVAPRGRTSVPPTSCGRVRLSGRGGRVAGEGAVRGGVADDLSRGGYGEGGAVGGVHSLEGDLLACGGVVHQ